MQRAADTSRFLIDFFSIRGLADSKSVVSHGDLLQYVLNRLARTANSRQLFNELAQRLIQVAEHSFDLRDANALEEASLFLMNLPISNARQVGLYYQALAFSRYGKKNESLALLERVTDNAPLMYRARALLTSGAIHQAQGRLYEALRFYPEAVRAASTKNGYDALTTLVSCLNVSAIKSYHGNHQEALVDLEKLLPIVLVVAKQSPFYFYYYHADLAYELSQVGRVAEAEAACAVALASPFAHAYPEWSETRDEIAAKRQAASRSVIAINRAPEVAPSSKASTFCWPEREERISSSSSGAVVAITAIARRVTTQRALELVGESIQARAPPTLTRTI